MHLLQPNNATNLAKQIEIRGATVADYSSGYSPGQLLLVSEGNLMERSSFSTTNYPLSDNQIITMYTTSCFKNNDVIFLRNLVKSTGSTFQFTAYAEQIFDKLGVTVRGERFLMNTTSQQDPLTLSYNNTFTKTGTLWTTNGTTLNIEKTVLCPSSGIKSQYNQNIYTDLDNACIFLLFKTITQGGSNIYINTKDLGLDNTCQSYHFSNDGTS